jgi:hypothetical protein
MIKTKSSISLSVNTKRIENVDQSQQNINIDYQKEADHNQREA